MAALSVPAFWHYRGGDLRSPPRWTQRRGAIAALRPVARVRRAPESTVPQSALRAIHRAEYYPSVQRVDARGRPFERPGALAAGIQRERLHFANRAQGLRAYFDAEGMQLEDRRQPEAWHWRYRLERVGRQGEAGLLFEPATPELRGERIVFEQSAQSAIVTWYHNTSAGIEQGFTLHQRPPGAGALRIEGQVETNLRVSAGDGVALRFADATGDRLVYDKLLVLDARGARLPAAIAWNTHGARDLLALVIDDAAAVYPLHVDPLITAAVFNVESNQADAELGACVASAGDVNGDGFSDAIIAAPKFDNGQVDEGRVFVHHGSAAGLGVAPASTFEGNQAGVQFGFSVATAGDVNNDGFGDVIIGARFFDNGEAGEGRAFVHHGSAAGLATTPAWTAESDQIGAEFGYSVASAGDVNGDGYSDVIVGARFFDNGQNNEGRAYVYHGGAAGLSGGAAVSVESNQADAELGFSVSGAGDVNGDGFGDVIVGAPMFDNGEVDEGRALVFQGAGAGINAVAAWTSEPNAAAAHHGWSVSTAGDVNGDGYGDVIVGAPDLADVNPGDGLAFIYHGSAVGLSVAVNTTLRGAGNLGNADYGIGVALAGDVNGDGYADVVVGAQAFDVAGVAAGKVFVHQGSAAGVSVVAASILSDGQLGEDFGRSVGSTGDVNGDGFSDVIVGAPRFDNGENSEGKVFVYHGSGSSLSTVVAATRESDQIGAEWGTSVAGAGDVNGDGFADVVVGAPLYDNGQVDEGAVFVFHGSASGLSATANFTGEGNQAGARFGTSVAGAGDVNGDGFSDVIVGAPFYDNGELDEGRAYVFHGSVTGLAAVAAWVTESNQTNARYGQAVSGAGNINADFYGDVIVGAPLYDNGQVDEGRVYVYHGGAAGLATSADFTAESDQAGAEFGDAVGTAGDVNRDGYADVAVGAYRYDNGQNDEGRVYVYHGSGFGLATTANWNAESNQADALFGRSVTTAGDVNGDGFSDLIVGAPFFDNGQADEGQAFIYHGSGAGLSAVANTTSDSNQAGAEFGTSVTTLGDANGDGYSDVAVGAPRYDNGETDEGRVFIFEGSAAGLGVAAVVTMESNQTGAQMGKSVAAAGDITGDGFGDLIAGLPFFDNPENNEGASQVFYGAGGGGPTFLPRQVRADGTALLQLLGMSESENLMRIRLTGRSFLGRGSVKLQWEVKPLGTALDGSGLQTAVAFSASGLTGIALEATASGLTVHTRYHWRVRVVGFPGQYGHWHSVGPNAAAETDFITTDLTGPVGGTVNDGVGSDIDAQGSGTTLDANWGGFSDAQSGVAGYKVAIGTTPGGTEVAAFASVGTATTFNKVGLILIGGTTYFITVRAFNGAAGFTDLSTDGVLVDPTPPVAGTVNDGTGADVNLQGSTTTINANWAGFADPESGVATYDYAIGTTPGGTEVLVFTSVGLATSVTKTGLTLSVGVSYFVTVRATNGAALATLVTSNGVMIDSTPPIATEVKDGTGADIDLQASTTTLSANWAAFSDPESGVLNYQYTIGTTSGGSDVVGLTPLGLATFFTQAGLTLINGTKYFITVRATNGVGIAINVTSDGVTVDNTPPLSGTVNDGLGVDINFQSSATTISANWATLADAQSGIALYEWAIGTTAGGVDVQAYTANGVLSTATSAILALVQNTAYFVTVRATNGVGLQTITSSNGVTVDNTPPTAGTVNDGTGADISFQVSTSTVDANWTGFADAQSGIALYDYAIGTSAGAVDVLAFTGNALATGVSKTGLILNTGQKYFVTVRATSGAGLQVSANSNGVVVDVTAPLAGAVRDGTGADIAFQFSATIVDANWDAFADVESGIIKYEVALGTTPGGEQLKPFTDVALALNRQFTGLALVPGVKNYFTVRATNGAGLTVLGVSNGVTVDNTAPVAGVVNDGTAGDIDAQSSTTTISANWSGFTDAESGIALYEWAIGTSSGAVNVQAFKAVGLATADTTTGLALTQGQTYFITLRVTNGGGLQTLLTTDGIKVDNTAPVAGVVNDGAAADVNAQGSSTTIAANWTGFADAESNITGFEWAIGTTAGAVNVQAFTAVGLATSVNNSALALVFGQTYFVTVRATNGVGLTTVLTSNGVTVDNTAPVAATVQDGDIAVSASDIDFQTSTTAIHANWSGFFDTESSVAGYEFAIGTTAGGTNVQGFASVGAATLGSNTALALTNGLRYYVTVRATNGVGLTVTATSDGVIVDTTAPAAGVVLDGPGADRSSQLLSDTVAANWSGFADAQSGIVRYEWAIGTTAGGTQLQSFVNVGLLTNLTAPSVTTTAGTTVYVTVRATSGAGQTVIATSNGVAITASASSDVTAPVAGVVRDGLTATDIATQSSTTTISANWSGFADAESGIDRYEWAIGTATSATSVQAFTAVGTTTSATNSGLSLANGTTYIVTVRAINGAGLVTPVASNGVKVDIFSAGDSTPPLAGAVNDGPGVDVSVQTSTTTISANWSGFVDLESGIARFEWAIGTSPGGIDVQPFVDVSTTTSAAATGLSLATGATYFVTVRATNGVGLTSNATSNGVTVTGTPKALPSLADVGGFSGGGSGCAALPAGRGGSALGLWPAGLFFFLLLRRRRAVAHR